MFDKDYLSDYQLEKFKVSQLEQSLRSCSSANTKLMQKLKDTELKQELERLTDEHEDKIEELKSELAQALIDGKTNFDLSKRLINKVKKLQSDIDTRRQSDEDVVKELEVYHEMQKNLNTNLSEYPDILDTLETLQCSVFPLEEVVIPFQLEEKYFDMYHALKKDYLKTIEDYQKLVVEVYNAVDRISGDGSKVVQRN